MVKFFNVLIIFTLLSCGGTSNHQAAKSESFVFLLWVTKVDVCNQVLKSVEQQKVLFVMNDGVFGFALSETEKLVLNYNMLYKNEDRPSVKLFRSDPFQELYYVDLRVTEEGILIFVTPIIITTEPCKNRINTTSYIFSSKEPRK